MSRSSFSSSVDKGPRFGLGRGLGRDAHDETLDAAREEHDRRVAALRVERVEPVRDHLRERRLRRTPRLQRRRHDRRGLARTAQQVGDDVVGDHLLHLVRHARHRVDDLAVGQLAPQTRRGADRVRDRLAALGDVGLAQVVLRHVAHAGAEHLRDRLRELVVAHERHAHELGDRVAGQVVLGRPETAADEHRVRTRELIAQRGDDARPGCRRSPGARTNRCPTRRTARRSTRCSCRRSGRAATRFRSRGLHTALPAPFELRVELLGALPVDVAAPHDLETGYERERNRDVEDRSAAIRRSRRSVAAGRIRRRSTA